MIQYHAITSTTQHLRDRCCGLGIQNYKFVIITIPISRNQRAILDVGKLFFHVNTKIILVSILNDLGKMILLLNVCK